MKIFNAENVAKDVSELLAFIVFFIVLIVLGYQIEDVDETIYPKVVVFLLIYSFVGELVMMHKNIHPTISERIQGGKIDWVWSFKRFYWSAWWPSFLKK